LRKQGWRVIRIWEHDLSKKPSRCLQRIVKTLGLRVKAACF
jgi:very-short-patch-repair endonuclease